MASDFHSTARLGCFKRQNEGSPEFLPHSLERTSSETLVFNSYEKEGKKWETKNFRGERKAAQNLELYLSYHPMLPLCHAAERLVIENLSGMQQQSCDLETKLLGK